MEGGGVRSIGIGSELARDRGETGREGEMQCTGGEGGMQCTGRAGSSMLRSLGTVDPHRVRSSWCRCAADGSETSQTLSKFARMSCHHQGALYPNDHRECRAASTKGLNTRATTGNVVPARTKGLYMCYLKKLVPETNQGPMTDKLRQEQ